MTKKKAHNREFTHTVDIFDERGKCFILKKGEISEYGLRILLRSMTRLNLEKIEEFMVELATKGHNHHKTTQGHIKHYSLTVRSINRVGPMSPGPRYVGQGGFY